MIRNNWLFLNKIWNFTVFCNSLKWSTVCITETQWLFNKTAASAVFNFDENDVNFFNFFTATVNLCAFMFSRNHSNLKFIFYLSLHFFLYFLHYALFIFMNIFITCFLIFFIRNYSGLCCFYCINEVLLLFFNIILQIVR